MNHSQRLPFLAPLIAASTLFTILLGVPANAESQEDGASKKITPKLPAGGDLVARIRNIEGDEFALDDIKFNRATREIRFPAQVNMTENVIEYIIVTEKGKTHESLLSTKTSPFVLNVVMLLCRYKPSAEGLIQFVEREGPDGGGGAAAPSPESEEKTPVNPFAEPGKEEPKTAPAPADKPKSTQNLTQIFVRYKKEDGKETEVLLDDWVFNSATKKSLDDEFWVYTGSSILQGGDFGAELEGSIIAIYVDRSAMFNNPIKGNGNDDIWEPFTKRMPPVETPVEVIIRPFTPKEKKPEGAKE